MEPSFTFTIPNEKKRFYDRFALLLFVLNAAGILIRFFYFKEQSNQQTGTIAPLAIALLLLIYLFTIAYNNKIRAYIRTFTLAAFCLSVCWLLAGPWWIALLSFILIAFYLGAQRELHIIINTSHIIYPSLPKRKIQWTELNNLVLKDGLLTIDFKNDAIIQHYPEQKMNLPGEKEFNDFCRERLVASG